MQPGIKKLLTDMLEAAESIQRFAANQSLAELQRNDLLRSAIYFKYVIIGEALTQIRRHRPAVVAMDLGLPPHPNEPTEGFQLLQEILALAPDTKVIVLTGQNDHANALKAIALGAYDFYSKPFQPELLTHMIERAYRLHALQAENRKLLARRTPGVLGELLPLPLAA